MKREIEIGNNLGCLLVVVAVVAAWAAVSIFEMSPDSVKCVKAGGQWREPQGYCERGSKSP